MIFRSLLVCFLLLLTELICSWRWMEIMLVILDATKIRGWTPLQLYDDDTVDDTFSTSCTTHLAEEQLLSCLVGQKQHLWNTGNNRECNPKTPVNNHAGTACAGTAFPSHAHPGVQYAFLQPAVIVTPFFNTLQ